MEDIYRACENLQYTWSFKSESRYNFFEVTLQQKFFKAFK